MAKRDAWKTLNPEEQMIQLVRTVREQQEQIRQLTRIQGVRLEGRMVLGARHLYAVIDDPTAANDGAAYPLTP